MEGRECRARRELGWRRLIIGVVAYAPGGLGVRMDSALYGGYETDCRFTWKLKNPADRELKGNFKFPLPATGAIYDDLTATLFGSDPKAFAHVIERGGQIVGIAVWFITYSTWTGKHGLWLEDLFVLDSERGRGYGKALMRALAGVCVERGYSRFEWTVLDWNEPAIAFYQSLGVAPLDEWTTQRLTGDALTALAS